MSVLSDTRAFVGLPIFCSGLRVVHTEDKQKMMSQNDWD